LKDEAQFEEDLMGPFSQNADVALDRLRLDGLAEPSGGIRPTSKGKEAIGASKKTFTK
jgi:hypothetical protein